MFYLNWISFFTLIIKHTNMNKPYIYELWNLRYPGETNNNVSIH